MTLRVSKNSKEHSRAQSEKAEGMSRPGGPLAESDIQTSWRGGRRERQPVNANKQWIAPARSAPYSPDKRKMPFCGAGWQKAGRKDHQPASQKHSPGVQVDKTSRQAHREVGTLEACSPVEQHEA